MSKLRLFLGVAFLLISTPILSQSFSEQDLFKLAPEQFDVEGIEDGMETTGDDGNYYKLSKSSSARGFYIKTNNVWLKHGTWFQYRGGKMIIKTPYVKGKKEGNSHEYYTTGELMYSRDYVSNKLEGIVTKFRKNGNLERTSEYQNGKKHGLTKFYESDGVTIWDEDKYINGNSVKN